MRSYYHLVVHYSNDGPRPRKAEEFLAMVVGEVESEANFGPGKNLEVRKPGKLVGYTVVVPPNKDCAPYIEYLYRVRVYGPDKDIKLITHNMREEYGTIASDDKHIRKLGWKTYRGAGE